MRLRIRPEPLALLLVLVVVLTTSLAHVILRAFELAEDADRRARYAVSTSRDLEQKLDDLENNIEELRSELESRR
jgi:peptidoglycan hydrolase CwlO-like protein